MIQTDEQINKIFKELGEILSPKARDKLISHLTSLQRQIEDLQKSRDLWRVKSENYKLALDKLQVELNAERVGSY